MPRTREDTYRPALEKAVSELAQREPHVAAFKAGCDWNASTSQITVPYFDSTVYVAMPAGAARTSDDREPDVTTRLLVLHYLIFADGSPPGDRWVAFRELPDARVYDPAFQKRSALRLLHEFGNNERALVSAAEHLLAERIRYGDQAFLFRAFPRVRLALIWNRGDDEFPPSVQVLFDAGAGHYLPTEDLAVIGGELASKVSRAAR